MGTLGIKWIRPSIILTSIIICISKGLLSRVFFVQWSFCTWGLLCTRAFGNRAFGDFFGGERGHMCCYPILDMRFKLTKK